MTGYREEETLGHELRKAFQARIRCSAAQIPWEPKACNLSFPINQDDCQGALHLYLPGQIPEPRVHCFSRSFPFRSRRVHPTGKVRNETVLPEAWLLPEYKYAPHGSPERLSSSQVPRRTEGLDPCAIHVSCLA